MISQLEKNYTLYKIYRKEQQIEKRKKISTCSLRFTINNNYLLSLYTPQKDNTSY